MFNTFEFKNVMNGEAFFKFNLFGIEKTHYFPKPNAFSLGSGCEPRVREGAQAARESRGSR